MLPINVLLVFLMAMPPRYNRLATATVALPREKIVVIHVDSQTYKLPFTCETSSYELSRIFCKERNIVDKGCDVKISDLIIEEQIKLCNKLPRPWWYDYEKEIGAALWNGQIVKLPNAFFLPNRFDLQPVNNKEEDGIGNNDSEIAWEINRNNHNLDFTRYISKGKQVEDFIDEVEQHKEFLSNILLTDFNISKRHFVASKYTKGAYLDYHNDNSYDRVLSVVYHHTQNWNTSSCGGQLVWDGSEHLPTLTNDRKKKIIPISYNTLYLFIPRLRSGHEILKVKCNETKRYAISGWLTTKTPSRTYLALRRLFDWRSKSHQFGSYHEFNRGDKKEIFF